GVLYHTPEEQDYAQAVLGINHPRGREIGTWLDVPWEASPTPRPVQPNDGKPLTLIYCGRYSAQKDVPRLLEYAERYEAIRPGRFHWVFLGQGEVPLPRKSWITNAGFVEERQKRQHLESAAALVQLSR